MNRLGSSREKYNSGKIRKEERTEGLKSVRSDMFLFIFHIHNEQYKEMRRYKTIKIEIYCYDGARLSFILQKSSYSLVCSHYDTERLDGVCLSVG